MKKNILLLITCLIVIFFNSCTKSDNTPPPVVLSTEEFIKYTVNSMNHNFTIPVDKIFSANYLNNPQPPPTTLVYGERIPSSPVAYVNIQFERTGLTQGSTAILKFFYTEQTDMYPFYTTSPSQILINFTEYGNVGEYISGNFSGLFVGAPPSNNPYNITCSFRVKRVI